MTEEIAKEYPFVHGLSTKPRRGKHFIIDNLILFAEGDIIIIMDADREIVYDETGLKKLIECFNDSTVGGIGDYYTTTYSHEKVKKINNMLYLGDAWNTLFMLEYKMRNKNEKNFMFYVNFFRKDLFEGFKTKTLIDDGERYLHIINKGYKIALIGTEQLPMLKATYDSMSFWGFVATKVRGFIAEKQMSELLKGYSVVPDKLGMFTYILKNLHRPKRIRAYIGIILWWIAVFIALIKFKFMSKDVSTQEGWSMRMKT